MFNGNRCDQHKLQRNFVQRVIGRIVFFSKKIIVDTGFIVALFNAKDEWHGEAKKVAERVGHLNWCTTSFVVQEIFWLLSRRAGAEVAHTFLHKIESLFTLPNLLRGWPVQISKILERYASAKIDLADASLVVLADHLKTGQIVSVDRKDFSILRWNGGKSLFHNLMDATET